MLHPAFIKHYGLQGVSKYAREAAEFVNLYSKSRGVNRFPGLVEQLDWLRRRPEVKARGVDVADPAGAAAVDRERDEAGQSGARSRRSRRRAIPICSRRWRGREAVNEAIDAMVRGVPPFPFVRECLEQLAEPGGLARRLGHAQRGAARRMGGARPGAVRAGDLRAGARHEEGNAAPSRQQYPAGTRADDRRRPGRLQGGRGERRLFFPINPGGEEASWQRLFEEGIDRFLAGTFAGDYQQQLLDEFDQLPAGDAALASRSETSHAGRSRQSHSAN